MRIMELMGKRIMSALNKSEWGKKMVDYISESTPVEQEVARVAVNYERVNTPSKESKIVRGRFAPVDDVLEDLIRTAKMRRA